MRIKDIAREAGVSTATVSHVINKTKYVSDPTREKVQRAIKKFNYHPNTHAQSLALGKSKIIGLLVSDISNPFFPEVIKSIEAGVIASGYNLFLLNTNYEMDRTMEYVQRLIQMKVAGIILMIAEFDCRRKGEQYNPGLCRRDRRSGAASGLSRAHKDRTYCRISRNLLGGRSTAGLYRFDETLPSQDTAITNL